MEADGTEQELDEMVELLEASVAHPEVVDLIYYRERELTAEEIVEEALAYVPIQL